MKKYVLGILLVFVFMQPLASRALAYHNAANSTCILSTSSFSKENSNKSGLIAEGCILDADDEDEFSDSEPKNNISEFVLENHIYTNRFIFSTHTFLNKTYTYVDRNASKPLYVLWSVFRI